MIRMIKTEPSAFVVTPLEPVPDSDPGTGVQMSVTGETLDSGQGMLE